VKGPGPSDHQPGEGGAPETPDARLRAAIGRAAHLLPGQGPISVFIHHNTLHAFEHLPFDRAVLRGAALFGCEPYLPKARYRDALARGRVRFDDLQAVLEEELGFGALGSVARLATRIDLRLAMLQYPLTAGSSAELRWFLAETSALRKVRPEASGIARGKIIAQTRRWVMRDLRGRGGANPGWVGELFAHFGAGRIESWGEATWEAFTLEALWHVCRDGVRHAPEVADDPRPPARHRDLLTRAAGIDPDRWVHEVLIRFTAAFLDQGVSHWPLPDRERGFFRAFCTLYSHPAGPPERWMRSLPAEAARLLGGDTGPVESACESLAALGVPPGEFDEYLGAALLALRGWAGMVHHIETRGDRVAQPIPAGSLVEFVAVRLLLDRIAAAHAAGEVGYTGPLAGLRDHLRGRLPAPPRRGEDERAFPVFQLAQVLGWSPPKLAGLTPAGWAELVREIEGFPDVERRRVFHLAYELRFRNQCLDALALHPRREARRPRFQVVTCIDEREESFRRHLEEAAPDCETFGTAGFFAIPMYYRAATDAHFVPLCPIVVTPRHWVEERAEDDAVEAHRRALRARRLLGAAAHGAHVGTRTAAAGALLAGAFGVLASVPLISRTLFPRLTARVRRLFGRVVAPPPRARLKLERVPECAPGDRNGHLGFAPGEMVDMAERLLRDVGLTGGFARLVLILGHESVSMNNPHRSAYDCGACGGSSGAPNGRAAAQVLNDPRVRAGLAARGIAVPDTTVFVGGVHNTCDDSATLFDPDRVPATHADDLASVRRDLEEACGRNAHERCRRFMSAPLTLTPDEARQHVEGRSEDPAQTRPELGHATNALCVVGRRERTRGLFLDRRAFLTSYDPTRDDQDGTVLTRTMAAVFPVCGGINLEYYFSHVDNTGYGCGTKLPHNITSLLGVMDGAASDLRTGLPWQMVEIHEPVRLLIVCETTPEVMRKALDANPAGKRLADNAWVQLAVLLPHANEVLVYRDGEFRPYLPTADRLPAASSSVDWYRGWRDHLEFAEIAPESRGGHG
jgi:uncharacterized protein YbcC (UPF0753/DUF2309 family)